MRAEAVMARKEKPHTPEALIARVMPDDVPKLSRTEAFLGHSEAYDIKKAIEDPDYVPFTKLHQVKEYRWGKEKDEYTVTEKGLENIRAVTLAQEFFFDGFIYAAFGTLIAMNTFLLGAPMVGSAIMLLSLAYAFGKARESMSAARVVRSPLLMFPGFALALLLGGAFLTLGQAFVFAAVGWKLIAAKAAATVVGGWIAQKAGNNSRPWLAHTLSGWERKVDEV